MPHPRIVIGLLGAVASGKSHVAQRLAALAHGAVLDADALARFALEEAAADGRLRAALGPRALRADGKPDRAALRARAQRDPAVLRALEALTHPFVRARVAEAVERARCGQGPPVLVLDIPLLLETGLDALCDELWLVEVPDALRLARARARGLTADELVRWEQAQVPTDDRRLKARRRIRNDVSPDELDRQLVEGLAALSAV